MKKLLLAALCGLVANGCLAGEYTINFRLDDSIKFGTFRIKITPEKGRAKEYSIKEYSIDEANPVVSVKIDSPIKSIELTKVNPPSMPSLPINPDFYRMLPLDETYVHQLNWNYTNSTSKELDLLINPVEYGIEPG